MLSNDLELVAEILKAWASAHPHVRKLWIYGSRAKGVGHPNSDLDVALDIDPVGNDEDRFTSFVSECAEWEAVLQPQLPYHLHLEWYDPHGSNARVREGVHDSGILVYERDTSEGIEMSAWGNA